MLVELFSIQKTCHCFGCYIHEFHHIIFSLTVFDSLPCGNLILRCRGVCNIEVFDVEEDS